MKGAGREGGQGVSVRDRFSRPCAIGLSDAARRCRRDPLAVDGGTRTPTNAMRRGVTWEWGDFKNGGAQQPARADMNPLTSPTRPHALPNPASLMTHRTSPRAQARGIAPGEGLFNESAGVQRGWARVRLAIHLQSLSDATGLFHPRGQSSRGRIPKNCLSLDVE